VLSRNSHYGMESTADKLSTRHRSIDWVQPDLFSGVAAPLERHAGRADGLSLSEQPEPEHFPNLAPLRTSALQLGSKGVGF
jgi:hypothetical protein